MAASALGCLCADTDQRERQGFGSFRDSFIVKESGTRGRSPQQHLPITSNQNN